ncbi:hypothetical protein [Saccharococcus sp. Marseille-Q5394]|nr:hypothetical protein [Saccharococcus sp. Marseille-Q5394]
MYGTIVFVHVVSAVLAIGPLFLLLPTIKRLRNVDLPTENAYLTIIKIIIRLVMHAGHLLVISGALLLLTGPWPWYTSWVITTLAIMLASGVFLSSGFTKVLRRYYLPNSHKGEILTVLTTTAWIYIGLMLVMLWLMVQKPMLW